MPSPAWENLDDFLSTDDFAVWATIQTQAGPVTLAGIYDDPHMDAQLGEYTFDTNQPRFMGKETDLAGVKRNDTAVVFTKHPRTGAVIWSKNFDVLDGAQATGDGMAVVKLAEV